MYFATGSEIKQLKRAIKRENKLKNNKQKKYSMKVWNDLKKE